MTHPSPNERPTNALEPEGFPSRLKEAIGDNSIRGFARECGFSDTVLRQYLSGQSEPTRPALLAIARTAQVGLEWLAVGSATLQDSAIALAEQYIYKEPLAFETNWLQTEFPQSFENLMLVRVEDDSMEPTLMIGSLVLVDTECRNSETIDHGIYLFKLEDRIFIKRLQYLPGNCLRVLSDNPAYEAFSLGLAEKPSGLSLMGKVVWCGRKL